MSAELEKAYLKHRHSLLAIALNVTQCQSLAEDALQIGFSNLVRSSFQASDLEAYLFKTVRNAAVDIVRRRKRETTIVESLFFDSDDAIFQDNDRLNSSQSDEVSRREEHQMIRNTIDSLPPPDREIVLLKIFSEFTFEKIADITSSNPNTVATRYRRLLQKLKNKLKEHA